MMLDKLMGITEVRRNFAKIVDEVAHGGTRVIVERRGRPVVAIVPLEEKVGGLLPGQRLAAAIGFGKQEGESFCRLMENIVVERGGR